MRLTDRQIQAMKNSDARLNIWQGAVRSGKTHGLFELFNHYVHYGPKGKKAIIARTLETLRENILDPMINLIGSNMSYSDNGRRIVISGHKIRGVGANDERSKDKIWGDTLAGAMGDEVTLWPKSFFNALLSRMSVPGAQAFFSCNPDSPYHWLKTDYIDRQDELDLSVTHFLIDDNPTLDQNYVDNLKKEYTGHWYSRYIDGLWVLAEGVIYDMFDAKIHVRESEQTYDNYIVGVDYGTSNPCTFGLYGWNVPEDIQLIREYYYDSGANGNRQKTDAQYADAFEDFISGIAHAKTYVDPSAASFRLELRKRGYNAVTANNDVADGIRFVARKLTKKEYHIDPICEHTIKEFGVYSWDANAQKRGEDKPIKSNDHAMDRDRYALYSHFGQKQYRKRQQKRVV